MKKIIAYILVSYSLVGVAEEILSPQILASQHKNQITVSIPLNYEMPEAPATTFLASFRKKGGKKDLILQDAFLATDSRSIIATGFITSDDKQGSYKLAGIFYQGQMKTESSGRLMTQANCQKRHGDGDFLSCYDNGVLRPESYKPIQLEVPKKSNDRTPVHDYKNLTISASSLMLDSGQQKVVVSVSSTPLVFRYFINYVVFSGSQTAYFQPQELAQVNSERNIVSLSHTFPAMQSYGDETPLLRGLVIEKLYGRNEFGEFISISCNKENMKYEIEITQRGYPQYGDALEGYALNIPCATVK